ncbi:MAG TPA: hypothetical protein VFX70_07275, partial [Mycobacteriales bacterium]|nr:hypothetical protein [Mycobacteriales bacterium]
MPRYVDIGVVHIQRYLSRTPTLRGRRGASAALAEVTAEAESWLHGRGKVNPQAGKVDGVLSLVVDLPETEEALVSEVLEHLRAELPGAEFQVTSGDGEDYLRAYLDELRPMVDRGDARVDLPAGAEYPLAALCEICRVDPAITHVDLGADDGKRAACADCDMRHEPKTRKKGRTTEKDLIDATGSGKAPEKFDDLAALAGADAKEHLATIHADGNGIGQFFATLAGSGGGVDRASVVKQLTASTFEALSAATCAVRRSGDAALCVVPHLLGGDDVLVSLPADRAWQFTVAFVEDFGQRMARLVRSLNVPGLTPPTMSAGVVFGRRNFPFALGVEQAERLLHRAKSRGAGRAAWIGFADMVSEGTGSVGDPVSLAALRRLGDELGSL